MAVKYTRSTDGSDADNGTTWALANATIAGSFADASAGDRIFCSSNAPHSESTAGTVTLTSPGTAASPCEVLSGNDAAEPPTTVAGGAIIANTGNSPIQLNGFCYWVGFTFNVGSGSGGGANFNIGSATTPLWQRFDGCAINIVNTNGSGRINVGNAVSTSTDDQLVEFINTTLTFAQAGQGISPAGRVRMCGGSVGATGTVPTTMILPRADAFFDMEMVGVDLSAFGSGKSLISISTLSSSGRLRLVDCKLGSSVAITTGSHVGQGGIVVELINCDSADTNYRYYYEDYAGVVTHETTIVRSGGASDGTTAVSRKMATTANAKFYSPLASDWVVFWNETTGSPITVSIPVLTDNVTLTDAEAWIELEYLGTSGVPLGSFAHDRAADVLAGGTNQTTDGVSSWTTTGLGTPVKQLLSKAVTPQEKGLVRARVLLAKPSTTLYFDPLAQVT